MGGAGAPKNFLGIGNILQPDRDLGDRCVELSILRKCTHKISL